MIGNAHRANPLSHALRRASSPERGSFFAPNRQMLKAPPSGELANAVSLRGFALPQALMEGVARRRRSGGTDYKHKKDGSHTTAVLFNVT